MQWYAVIAVAYQAGLTEFVHLCHEAPLAQVAQQGALHLHLGA